MLDFLAELGVPTIVALTKADKLTKADARAKVAGVSRMLALEPDQVIQFSTQTGEGRMELLEAIAQLVEKA
jgi:GTP-binding protein